MSAKKSIALGDDVVEIPQFLRRAPVLAEAAAAADEPQPESEAAPLVEPAPEPEAEAEPEPIRELEQPERKAADLESMEALVIAATKEPMSVIKIAATLRLEQSAKMREIKSTRSALVDRKELLMRLFEGAAAAIDERIADCDAALNIVTNGIGPDTEQES